MSFVCFRLLLFCRVVSCRVVSCRVVSSRFLRRRRGRAGSDAPGPAGEKMAPFVHFLYTKLIILPRQARDKHRKPLKTVCRFLAGANAGRVPRGPEAAARAGA